MFYLKKFKNLIIGIFVSSLLTSLSALFVQLTKGDLLDSAILGGFNEFKRLAFLLFLFIVSELVFHYVFDIYRNRFSVDATNTIRKLYFDDIISKRYSSIFQKAKSEYASEYTSQITTLQQKLFTSIPLLFDITLKILIICIALFVLDYRLALITLFLLTTPIYVPKFAEKQLRKAQDDRAEEFNRHLAKFINWLDNIEEIKNYFIEKKISFLFAKSAQQYALKDFSAQKLTTVTRTISACLSYFSHLIILAISAYFVLRKEFSPGEFFIAVGLIDQLSYPIISLSIYLQDIISVRNIYKRFMIDEVEFPNQKAEFGADERNDILLKNLEYAYQDQNVVRLEKEMNLLCPGFYLFSGKSGTGKTTILNLIMGYLVPKTGDVLIGDLPVSEEASNRKVTVMRQDSSLFEDTLRNNLSMYKDVPDDELIRLLNLLGLEKFACTEALDQLITEDASNISGGEKRRFLFLRALLSQKPILILDEPFANVDPINIEKMEKLLFTVKDKLVLIVSHQYSESLLQHVDGHLALEQ